MDKKQFCVIMPCYNSELWVKDAIKSVTDQTYPGWKLILINDGSVDSTLDILNENAKSDDRIQVISKENGGYVSAVNLGLNYISGDYFLFLGSDDSLDVNLFENLNAAIEQLDFDPDCIGFRTLKKIDGVIGEKDIFTDFSGVEFENSTTLKRYEDKNPAHAKIFSTRDTSKCFKTELLGKLRYLGKYGIDADGIFSMMFCHRAKSFLSVPCVGYYWTLRSDSVSSSYSIPKNMDRIKNWCIFFEELSELNNDEITRTELFYFNYAADILFKSIKLSMNNRRFVKDAARRMIKVAGEIYPGCNLSALKFFANMPVTYVVLRKVKDKIKKLRKRALKYTQRM